MSPSLSTPLFASLWSTVHLEGLRPPSHHRTSSWFSQCSRKGSYSSLSVPSVSLPSRKVLILTVSPIELGLDVHSVFFPCYHSHVRPSTRVRSGDPPEFTDLGPLSLLDTWSHPSPGLPIHNPTHVVSSRRYRKYCPWMRRVITEGSHDTTPDSSRQTRDVIPRH